MYGAITERTQRSSSVIKNKQVPINYQDFTCRSGLARESVDYKSSSSRASPLLHADSIQIFSKYRYHDFVLFAALR